MAHLVSIQTNLKVVGKFIRAEIEPATPLSYQSQVRQSKNPLGPRFFLLNIFLRIRLELFF